MASRRGIGCHEICYGIKHVTKQHTRGNILYLALTHLVSVLSLLREPYILIIHRIQKP